MKLQVPFLQFPLQFDAALAALPDPYAGAGERWRHLGSHGTIIAQPTVRFTCGDAEINMAAGECWSFDTWRQHRVVTDAARPRHSRLAGAPCGLATAWIAPDGLALEARHPMAEEVYRPA